MEETQREFSQAEKKSFLSKIRANKEAIEEEKKRNIYRYSPGTSQAQLTPSTPKANNGNNDNLLDLDSIADILLNSSSTSSPNSPKSPKSHALSSYTGSIIPLEASAYSSSLNLHQIGTLTPKLSFHESRPTSLPRPLSFISNKSLSRHSSFSSNTSSVIKLNAASIDEDIFTPVPPPRPVFLANKTLATQLFEDEVPQEPPSYEEVCLTNFGSDGSSRKSLRNQNHNISEDSYYSNQDIKFRPVSESISSNLVSSNYLTLDSLKELNRPLSECFPSNTISDKKITPYGSASNNYYVMNENELLPSTVNTPRQSIALPNNTLNLLNKSTAFSSSNDQKDELVEDNSSATQDIDHTSQEEKNKTNKLNKEFFQIVKDFFELKTSNLPHISDQFPTFSHISYYWRAPQAQLDSIKGVSVVLSILLPYASTIDISCTFVNKKKWSSWVKNSEHYVTESIHNNKLAPTTEESLTPIKVEKAKDIEDDTILVLKVNAKRFIAKNDKVSNFSTSNYSGRFRIKNWATLLNSKVKNESDPSLPKYDHFYSKSKGLLMVFIYNTEQAANESLSLSTADGLLNSITPKSKEKKKKMFSFFK